ncbi:MAG: hypothetical protein EDQ89_09865, partial [Acidobacteria bacterium]
RHGVGVDGARDGRRERQQARPGEADEPEPDREAAGEPGALRGWRGGREPRHQRRASERGRGRSDRDDRQGDGEVGEGGRAERPGQDDREADEAESLERLADRRGRQRGAGAGDGAVLSRAGGPCR